MTAYLSSLDALRLAFDLPTTLSDQLLQDWVPRVIKAYGLPPPPGWDLHSLIACRIFHTAYDEVSPIQRQFAKRQMHFAMYAKDPFKIL